MIKSILKNINRPQYSKLFIAQNISNISTYRVHDTTNLDYINKYKGILINIMNTRMKIRYVSDLHLEFLENFPIIRSNDIDHDKYASAINDNLISDNNLIDEEIDLDINAKVLVLAGDIGNPYQDLYENFLVDVSKNGDFDKIFMITGNHEYYAHGNTIEDTNIHIKNLINVNNLENVIFLDNDYYIHGRFRFVGTTLWSNITKGHKTKYLTNCFFQIKDFKKEEIGLPAAVSNYNALFAKNYLFLENIPNDDLTNVFITHHLPTFHAVDPQYRDSKANQCFASSCEKLMRNNTKYWFYGHTHTPSDLTVNGTRLLCNPIGYPGENDFPNMNKTITLL